MPWPPAYFPVYSWHVRLPEPSLHANPLIQTPPIPHLEGSHLIQWLFSDPKQRSRTVLGDSQPFALKDHDSGKLIPHLPIPLMAGPFLLETLHASKYQVLFHQPNVLLDGAPVGVFQWVVAPPWRCFEIVLPMPKFLARRGREAAERAAQKQVDESTKKVLDAWSKGDPDQLAKAMAEDREAEELESRRRAQLQFEERQRELREAERKALQAKRESDRLSRRARAAAYGPDGEAIHAFDAAQQRQGAEQEQALALAKAHRAQAARARQGGRAWEEEALLQQASAERHHSEARAQRAAWRKEAEARAIERRPKKENPVQQATGESNAGLLAPSLFAHLPFPATVEIQVSWSRIGQTWLAALVNEAAGMLKYYVGFVFDGILAPGKSKGQVQLLDLAKSLVTDTIDGGAKFLVEGTARFKISKKLGVFSGSLQCEPDPATGTWKWQATLEANEKGTTLPGPNPKLTLEGHGASLPEKVEIFVSPNVPHVLRDVPVDYAHGVPAVN